jgi:hypothetical protein
MKSALTLSKGSSKAPASKGRDTRAAEGGGHSFSCREIQRQSTWFSRLCPPVQGRRKVVCSVVRCSKRNKVPPAAAQRSRPFDAAAFGGGLAQGERVSDGHVA